MLGAGHCGGAAGPGGENAARLAHSAASEARRKLRSEQRQKERLGLDGVSLPPQQHTGNVHHPRLDQFKLKQQQQQLLRSSGTGPSSYATALPGKYRIIAWLDESDMGYATVTEADNTPHEIALSPAPLLGSFLSSLKCGHYHDLAGVPVTRDVLIERGMQKVAHLLPPDNPPPQDAGKLEGPGGSLPPGPATGAPQSTTPLVLGKIPCPLPKAPAGEGKGESSVGQTGRARLGSLSGPLDGSTRLSGSPEAAGASGGEGSPAGGAGGDAAGSREASVVMHELMRKTATMLRQRSLDAEARQRLAGVADQEDAAAAAERAGGAGRGAEGGGGQDAAAGTSEGEGATQHNSCGTDEGSMRRSASGGSGGSCGGPGLVPRRVAGDSAGLELGSRRGGRIPLSAPLSPNTLAGAGAGAGAGASLVSRAFSTERLAGSSWGNRSPLAGGMGSATDALSRGAVPPSDRLSDLDGDSAGGERSPCSSQ